MAEATNELTIPQGREWLMVNRDTVDDLLTVRCAVEPLAAEHRAILNAIAARSPAEARCAMALHLTVAKRQFNMIQINDMKQEDKKLLYQLPT